jgi:outer membrane receptor protein involved in Fe transport
MLLAALATGAPAIAAAADAPAPEGSTLQEVVVTGSHIRQNGLQSPVPLTMVTSTELKAMAPTTLVEGLVQLPQFYNSQTPNSGNYFTRGGYGNLDIRGLGINRTLTLLSGRRVISQTVFGGVDVNMFPQAMISSVQTVTGGASAAYGTDAVAGVANFLLDTRFTGVKLTVQGGMTTRSDGRNYDGSIALGHAFLGDKLHVMASAEYFRQDGIRNYHGRDWYQGWGTVPDANGMLLIRPHVVSKNSTFDGLIVSPNAALNGLAFKPDGSTYQFQNSSLTSGNVGTAAARQSIVGGGSGDDLGAQVANLYPDYKRYSVFGYGDYDVTDKVKVFVQYLRGKEDTFGPNAPRGSIQGAPTAVTIFSGNAFLPAAIQQIMTANNIASFTLRRTGSSADIGDRISIGDSSLMNSVTTGFNWDVGSGLFGSKLFKDWVVDGYYQYGANQRRQFQIGLRVDRLFAAVDAVRNSSGQIVCRTSTFNNQFPGCQPLNLFGQGNASPAAVDYVVGFEPGQQITTPLYFAGQGYAPGISESYTTQEAKVNTAEMTQHVAELSANGEVYKGWGAGPVTAAFGGSYRQEHIFQWVQDVTNVPSDMDHGHPVLCNSDAAAIAAGLRGVSQADCTNTVGVQFSKVSNILGTIRVSEAFAETAVPVIADKPLVKLLKVDLAARYANYSGSGSIWAYKFGADWQLVEGLRLRGTYSRDVRAANLSERYDKTGGSASITDPMFPSQGPVNVTTFSGGNPAVRPEKADTFTAGTVFQPKWTPGLQLSVDAYQIKIQDAIGQIGTQNVVNQCFQGAADLCSLVTRDPTTHQLILVGNQYVNINQSTVRGVDFEGDYSTSLHLIGGGPESLTARFLGSWLIENSQINNGAAKINRAGQVGIQQSDGVPYALPTFKFTLNATYTNGPFSGFLQGRFISSGTLENALKVGKDIERNSVPAVFYTDFRLSYHIGPTELYGTITNLFDVAPPVTPYYSTFLSYSQQYNPALYDVLGRRFVMGATLRF